MFRNPKVTTIHAQLAAMYAQRMAFALPAVLVGDFNLKPGRRRVRPGHHRGDRPRQGAY
jgi:endonuclease/exonuclease/phosphatase family metal-dependent hydrolase